MPIDVTVSRSWFPARPRKGERVWIDDDGPARTVEILAVRRRLRGRLRLTLDNVVGTVKRVTPIGPRTSPGPGGVTRLEGRLGSVAHG